MKNCPFCNNSIADDATFCGFCGNKLPVAPPPVAPVPPVAPIASPVIPPIDSQINPPVNSQPNERISVSISSKYSNFVSEDEYVVATLKNGMMLNMLSGEGLKTEDAILTNKRMYYNHSTGILNVHSQEEKVNIKDITGSKIASYNPLGILFLGILVLVAGIVVAISKGEMMFMLPAIPFALFFVLLYFFARKSFLRIEYAGGVIRFSVKKYGKEKIRAFQKSIYAIKDQIENQNK